MLQQCRSFVALVLCLMSQGLLAADKPNILGFWGDGIGSWYLGKYSHG